MYTIRTVLPYKDNTDERPTIVNQEENNFILFSGKVGNCVEASEQIIEKLNIWKIPQLKIAYSLNLRAYIGLRKAQMLREIQLIPSQKTILYTMIIRSMEM